ncbi:unnamed protein product [Didymodactylos carnosus]|uniref:Glucosidase II subunit alpha n=1 Tax=Didymodactylos carnosus TaxID=1234261 RepID=A0A813XFG9_9BILA|nr:unnamed protein product [Didymodactylos carnosus]CAF0869325.1 unnamed protein product [Didymodactylos carnosus]CAF3615440.1 unnamed protein product [Didymodactylos carnosus]CAF3656768.1 unnamed protein product [Didymodactylos carnosus]
MKTVTNGHLQFVITNTQNNVKFQLDLFTLEENSLRMKINELEPIRKRYEVQNVIVNEPKLVSVTTSKLDVNQLEGHFGKTCRFILVSNPFRLDLFTNENVFVVSVNSKQLFNFEHYRKKQSSDGETPLHDEDGMWEETYKTHTDSKPHGPSSIGIDINFVNFENVYGIPEHADSFSLKSTHDTDPYRLFNVDVFEYDIQNPMALYGSIPYMLAHNEQTSVGFFWLNAAEGWIDITNNKLSTKNLFSTIKNFFGTTKVENELPEITTHWMFESGIFDGFFFLGPTPRDVFRQYGLITGTTPLPPLWAIAYHQCRWNYNDEDDIKNVNAGFEHHMIPMDVLWLDIEHTNGKRYFTWDTGKFPNPEKMQQDIALYGRKMVTISDPHIKKDDNYHIYADAKLKQYFVKSKDGSDYEGWCWPGSSMWLDYFNPEIFDWYASRYSYQHYKGSTSTLFLWNDMNEPSVFNGPEVTFPKDVVHYGDLENRDVHNIYGMLQHMATFKGLLDRSEGRERPFILTRSFFAGSQRTAAVWTGDNAAQWSHLKMVVPMLLSLSVTGIGLVGADVGGFFKNPDPKLIVRWYQAASFQPFFREHAHIDTARREPWLFGDDNTRLIRQAIETRYTYLPYWYTLFYKQEKQALPPMLPLWAVFPHDTQTFKKDDSFMIGNSLLVYPITDADVTEVSIYFPGNNTIWYDIRTFIPYNGSETLLITVDMESIPVYQRGGSIIPQRLRKRRSSMLAINDPITLIVTLDKNNEARGELYMDDGHTYDYKKKRQFIYRRFLFKNNELTSSSLNPNGKFDTTAWIERIVIMGYPRNPNKVSINSGEQTAIPLHSYHDKQKVVIIRRPGPSISTDWTLTIS